MGWLARRKQMERLRSARVTPEHAAPVEVQIMGRASLDVLRARNVSSTGLGVFVPHGFAGIDLSQEVDLVVTLPGERPFLARGIVRHVTGSIGNLCHFGVELSRIETRDRDALLRYVSARLGD